MLCKMAKRQNSSKDNDATPSKRPMEAGNGNHSDEDDNLGVIELESDPAKLIQNIQTILEYQKKAVPHLYPSKKRNVKTGTLASLIQTSLTALDDRLENAKKVNVSIATFGALGKGKSFILNHVLKYNLSNDYLNLLPSGDGESKTPVPVKIRYGPKLEVIGRTSEKSDIWLSEEFNKSSIEKAAKQLENAFHDIESHKDLECVDVVARFPVFQYLKEMVKSKCTYQDVQVEIEFVDLPGRGDKHGNALIGKELNHADIMLVFKNSESARPVSIDDLKEVFERRDVFDYANRPKFVVIENQRTHTTNEEFAQEKRKHEEYLAEEWKILQELREFKDHEKKKTSRECYKVVYERLPLTTAKEFLEKFEEESKSLIFSKSSPKRSEEFISDLGEAIVEHVNGVILKKNIHPVMKGINKDANTRKKRISAVIRKEKETRQVMYRGPDSLPFEFSLDSSEDEDFFIKIEDLSLDLHAEPDILEAHNRMVCIFKELTMDHLLTRLRFSLQGHYETLLNTTTEMNDPFVSDQGFIHFARMLCETELNTFMEEDARGLVKNCLKKLIYQRPSSEKQKQWKESHDDEEQKKKLLEDHFNALLQNLASLLSTGSREDKLNKLLLTLHEGIENMITSGLKSVGFVDANNDGTLNDIKKSNAKFSRFSLKMMREVNPQFEHKKEFLDSKADFPDPFQILSTEHESNKLPPINHTRRLKDILNKLSKNKKGVLDELRKMLGLDLPKSPESPPVLPVPDGYDEVQWTRILLNVLQFDAHFHHMTLDNSLYETCKVEVGTCSIPDPILKIAKQQLFAFQKSNVKCDITQDGSVLNDTIRINVNDDKDGFTALVSPDLLSELKKLEAQSTPTKHLAPVFIPTIHHGSNGEELANLYLQEDPWTPKEEDDEDDDDDGTVVQAPMTVDEQPTGLEELPATIFCVIEPDHEEKFRSTWKKKPIPGNISFRYVILPQNGRGIGVSRSITKLLAEALKLPLYWTVDDDIKSIKEFNKDSGRWKRCTIGRALLFVQNVYKDCTDRVVKDLTEDERYEYGSLLSNLFPAWAKRGKRVAMRLMYDEKSYKDVESNIFCLNGQFTDEIMQEDCKGDPEKISEWCAAKENYVEKFKGSVLDENYKRIGKISIGHEISGRKNGYYSRSDAHYRKSIQNYQMVLHNTNALKGFNYVTDDVVLREEESTVQKEELRNLPHLGMEGEDKSFCKALQFYGVTGYQVITLVLSHQRLRDAIGARGYEH